MKLGVLGFGRKRPGFDQEWNGIMRERCVAALLALGHTCVGADAPVIDDASIAERLRQIADASCECLVVLQPSLGHGQLALAVMQGWTDPLVLWATPERPTGEKVSSCSLVAQHLWASILRQANHPFEFVYGGADERRVMEEMRQAIALAAATRMLRHAKLGIIGAHAPGFVDLAADPFVMRQQLGVQLHSLSLVQFIERVRGIDAAQVRKDGEAASALGLAGKGERDLEMNSRCYLALKEIMQEEKLEALALQ